MLHLPSCLLVAAEVAVVVQLLSCAALLLAPLSSFLPNDCRMRGTSCCWSAPGLSWSAC